MIGKKVRTVLVALGLATLISVTASAQWPYAPPAPPTAPPPLPPSAPFHLQQAPAAPQPVPPAAHYQRPAPAQQPQPTQNAQKRLEYAFRPELTNPQYGQCLALERNWKDLWHQYAQGYQQIQTLNPQDPRYAQMSYYLADLKRRVDAAWHQFSSECIYFPSNRK